jgi:hypothetical protein
MEQSSVELAPTGQSISANMKYISCEDYPKLSLDFHETPSMQSSGFSPFSGAVFSYSSSASSQRDSPPITPRESLVRLEVGGLKLSIEDDGVDYDDIEKSGTTFSRIDWNPQTTYTRECLKSVPPDLVLAFPSEPSAEIKEKFAVGEQRVTRSMVRKRKSQGAHQRRKTRSWTSWNESQKGGVSTQNFDSMCVCGWH